MTCDMRLSHHRHLVVDQSHHSLTIGHSHYPLQPAAIEFRWQLELLTVVQLKKDLQLRAAMAEGSVVCPSVWKKAR